MEGHHNYFAYDYLVHNCNVAASGTASAFATSALGLSAFTPPGALAAGAVFLGSSVGYEYIANSYPAQAIYNWAFNKSQGEGDSAASGEGVNPKSSNQMQKEVERGQAPKTIERVDKGVDRPGLTEKPHIHLDDGSAINNDGTWKHGGRALTEAEKQWILKSGWKLPQ